MSKQRSVFNFTKKYEEEGVCHFRKNISKLEIMGNQLVGAAPAQIFPVEHYMSDIADLEFDSSLGSTRFLKAARYVIILDYFLKS